MLTIPETGALTNSFRVFGSENVERHTFHNPPGVGGGGVEFLTVYVFRKRLKRYACYWGRGIDRGQIAVVGDEMVGTGVAVRLGDGGSVYACVCVCVLIFAYVG